LSPLTFSSHRYPALHVVLLLYVCRRWKGLVTARERQKLSWVRPQRFDDYPMPPADKGLVAALRDLL
ncbi:MAG: 8-oxo-dGTP diphosphatase MutT, partial [Stellaceae bacterium]